MNWRGVLNLRTAPPGGPCCAICTSWEIHGAGDLGLCFGPTDSKRAPMTRDFQLCDAYAPRFAKNSAVLKWRAVCLATSSDAQPVPPSGAESDEAPSRGTGTESPVTVPCDGCEGCPGELVFSGEHDLPCRFENVEAEHYFGCAS